MNNEQLNRLKAWFDDFVSGFYSRKGRLAAGDDEYINANIKLKEDHSKRVCEEMLFLAGELSLNENQCLLAETIALLHDVGRFPQFKKYHTYHDLRSTNHCLLALDVIREEKLLAGFADDEIQIIETAIKYHGDKELPAELTGDTLLLSKMIRDADKIDIYYVVTEAYMQYRDDPDNFKLELELPDIDEYSRELLDAVITGGLIDYKLLRSINDIKLCQLSWVYDVNFPATLARIKQRRHIEMIFDFLPDTEDFKKAREKIFTYIDSRLQNEN